MKIIKFLTKCNAVSLMTSITESRKLQLQNKKQNFSKRRKKKEYAISISTLSEKVLLQNTRLFIPASLISSKYKAIHRAVFTVYNWSTSRIKDMNLRWNDANLRLLIIFNIPKTTQHASPRNVLFQLQSRTCFNKQYSVAYCKSVIASLVSANNRTLQEPLAYVCTMDGRLLHNSCADILHSSYICLTLTV